MEHIQSGQRLLKKISSKMKWHTSWWQNSGAKGSAEWILKIKWNNTLPDGRIVAKKNQQRTLTRRWDDTLSVDRIVGGSAEWILMRWNNALSGDRTATQKNQQNGFQQGNMTHLLVAEWQHRRVNRMDFNKMRWRTTWWQNHSTEKSAEWILMTKPDNALPGGRIAAQEGQQDGF